MATPALSPSGYSLIPKSAPQITPRPRTLWVVGWAIGVKFSMPAFTSGSVRAFLP